MPASGAVVRVEIEGTSFRVALRSSILKPARDSSGAVAPPILPQNSFQETHPLRRSHFRHPPAGMNPETSPVTPADLVRRAVREFESPLVGYAAGITHDLDAA